MKSKLQDALDSLTKSTESLRARNDQLAAYLEGKVDPASRVANAAEMRLDEVTARAKSYWDDLEKKRSHK
jgi:hypothetical protein